jgi:hypothetical protein
LSPFVSFTSCFFRSLLDISFVDIFILLLHQAGGTIIVFLPQSTLF